MQRNTRKPSRRLTARRGRLRTCLSLILLAALSWPCLTQQVLQALSRAVTLVLPSRPPMSAAAAGCVLGGGGPTTQLHSHQRKCQTARSSSNTHLHLQPHTVRIHSSCLTRGQQTTLLTQ